MQLPLFGCWAFSNIKSLKLIFDTTKRWCFCWSKKNNSPHLSNFRRGGGRKKSIARSFLFDQHQAGCWASTYGRFLNENLNSSAYKKGSPDRPIFLLLYSQSSTTIFLDVTLLNKSIQKSFRHNQFWVKIFDLSSFQLIFV